MEYLIIAAAAAFLLLIASNRKRRFQATSADRARAMPTDNEPYMTGLPVVGTAHRYQDAEEFAELARETDVEIRLVAEPDNAHDEFAIKVVGVIPPRGMIRGERHIHIGYIPRRAAYRIGMNAELPRLRASLAYASPEPGDDMDGPEILIDIART